MSDIADKVSRTEGLQQGLSEYLPLLLKRFEGIEERVEADLKETRRDIEADLKSTQQELKADLNAAEQKIESKLNETRQDARNHSRAIIISVLGTGLAIAARSISPDKNAC